MSPAFPDAQSSTSQHLSTSSANMESSSIYSTQDIAEWFQLVPGVPDENEAGPYHSVGNPSSLGAAAPVVAPQVGNPVAPAPVARPQQVGIPAGSPLRIPAAASVGNPPPLGAAAPVVAPRVGNAVAPAPVARPQVGILAGSSLRIPAAAAGSSSSFGIPAAAAGSSSSSSSSSSNFDPLHAPDVPDEFIDLLDDLEPWERITSAHLLAEQRKVAKLNAVHSEFDPAEVFPGTVNWRTPLAFMCASGVMAGGLEVLAGERRVGIYYVCLTTLSSPNHYF